MHMESVLLHVLEGLKTEHVIVETPPLIGAELTVLVILGKWTHVMTILATVHKILISQKGQECRRKK